MYQWRLWFKNAILMSNHAAMIFILFTVICHKIERWYSPNSHESKTTMPFSSHINKVYDNQFSNIVSNIVLFHCIHIIKTPICTAAAVGLWIHHCRHWAVCFRLAVFIPSSSAIDDAKTGLIRWDLGSYKMCLPEYLRLVPKYTNTASRPIIKRLGNIK